MIYFLPIIVIILCIFFIARLPAFGSRAKASEKAGWPQSDHFKDGKFENLEDTPMSPPGVNLFTIIRDISRPHPDAVPHQIISVIKEDLKKPVLEPTITWFGHSSYLLQFPGKNFLIDPVFCQRTSPVQFIGSKAFAGTDVFQVADFPQIDYIIQTHDHYDHLDYAFMKSMKSTQTRFIVPLGVAVHLRQWGIDASRITELDWHQSTSLADEFEITATPARHFSGRGFNRNASLWTSYVFKGEELNLFLGGDSGYGHHFKGIGDQFGPFDLAILECGQYNTNWPYIHMMPEQTVQAAKDLRADLLLPVHWGKFKLSTHAWYEPIERATKAGAELEMPIITPRIGASFTIQDPSPTTAWWKDYM